ncbi:hypothetical protein PK35_07290 [Tamlana nanhaiensis]|uniref:Uncharacterized protein n=1 Tax=Neotamlana nanhaiensis TaxID=1382798 RepID=A0A0D7W3L4_9FLAO|nr:hypothetical protein [Tamlana nanhaiensis]KJD33629.1 hypothetical protein PK35_07290 [Tamlana nanhaiensis]
MRNPSTKSPILILVLAFLFFLPANTFSQENRLQPPRRESKIKSTDHFVEKTFSLYNKVFVYDSLTRAGVEIPVELEDELMERAEQDIDSLWDVVPDIVDDIADASFMKQAKATLNLNRAKKALKFCGDYVKTSILGTKEEEED